MALRGLAHSAIHLLLAVTLAMTAAAMPAHAVAGQFQGSGGADDMAGMPCGEMGGMGEGTTVAGDMPGGDCDLNHCDWMACLGIACLPTLPVAEVAAVQSELPGWTPVLRLSRSPDKLLRPPIA